MPVYESPPMPVVGSSAWSLGNQQDPFQVNVVEIQEAIDSLMDDHSEETKKDTESIKNSLILEPTGYPVEVYVIAYNRSGKKNMCQRIPCKKTKPLGNFCYDLQADQFLVDCAGFQYLGRFTQGYKLRMEHVEGWSSDAPLPTSVIERRLSSKNQKIFEDFKKTFSEKDHSYSFIQCSGVFNGQE